MSSIAERTAEIILETGAAGFTPDKPVRWVSGSLNPFYVDCRQILSLPKPRTEIIDLFYRKMLELNEEDPNFHYQEAYAGVLSAGASYAAILAHLGAAPYVMLRAEVKDHGKGSMVAGRIARDTTYIGIEDIYSTGGSTIRAMNNLREEAAELFPDNSVPVVTHTIAVMSYGWPKIQSNFEAANLTGVSLVTFPDLLKHGVQNKSVNSRMETQLWDWYENPEGWAERNNKTA